MFNSMKIMPMSNIMIKKLNPSSLSAKVHTDGRFKGKVAIVTASTEG